MTYAEIKTKVQAVTGRSNTEFADLILDWTNDVIRTICSKRNWWFLRTETPVTFVKDDEDYTLPTDYKDDYSLFINYGDNYYLLELKSHLDVLRGTDASTKGRPERWYLKGTTEYIVRPIPDKEYTGTMVYYRKFAEFVGTGNEDNWLTINAPDLVLAGILVEAYLYLQEEDRAGIQSQKFNERIKVLKREHVDRVIAQDETLIPKTGSLASTFEQRKDGAF